MSEITRVSPTTLMLDFLELTFAELAGQVGVELPESEQYAGGKYYAQVFQVDGPADIFGQEPILDIAVFHQNWRDAEKMAFHVEAALLGYPHRVSSGGKSVVIDRVFVPSAAHELPWEPGDATRFNMTVQLVLRG